MKTVQVHLIIWTTLLGTHSGSSFSNKPNILGSHNSTIVFTIITIIWKPGLMAAR